MTKKMTTNATLLRLKGTPFKTGTEMKSYEEKILKEEWQSVERARVRRELLMKEVNRPLISPFLNGFSAKFIGPGLKNENLIKIYLTSSEEIQVEIDQNLRSNDNTSTVESLVKSLLGGFTNGYLTALGLRDDSLFKSTAAKKTENI